MTVATVLLATELVPWLKFTLCVTAGKNTGLGFRAGLLLVILIVVPAAGGKPSRYAVPVVEVDPNNELGLKNRL